MATPRPQGGTAGSAVDAQGRATLDPSENVKALNEAGLKRQDDLRRLESKHVRELTQQRVRYEERMMKIRDEHDRELRSAEAARLDQLREAEAKRIDAIRAVDAAQVTRAAEVAAQQALTLAAQVATSAEALRTQVQAAATAGTIALNNALDPMQKRIDDLTRAQYEAQGQKTPDLAMAPILEAIRKLEAAQNQNTGQRTQVQETRQSNAAIYALIGAVGGLIVIAITVVGIILAASGNGGG